MTTKKIKTSDILGDNYYIYELTSSNYTPALNGTITITCTMKDVYGAAASGKSITLYQNGTSKGTQTTNSSGVATWSITCSIAGLQKFNIKDTSIEVLVDDFLHDITLRFEDDCSDDARLSNYGDSIPFYGESSNEWETYHGNDLHAYTLSGSGGYFSGREILPLHGINDGRVRIKFYLFSGSAFNQLCIFCTDQTPSSTEATYPYGTRVRGDSLFQYFTLTDEETIHDETTLDRQWFYLEAIKNGRTWIMNLYDDTLDLIASETKTNLATMTNPNWYLAIQTEVSENRVGINEIIVDSITDGIVPYSGVQKSSDNGMKTIAPRNGEIDLNDYTANGNYIYLPSHNTSGIDTYHFPSDITVDNPFTLIVENYPYSESDSVVHQTLYPIPYTGSATVYTRYTYDDWTKIGEVDIDLPSIITLSASKQKLNENESFKIYANVKDNDGNPIANKNLILMQQYDTYSNPDMSATGWVRDASFYVDDMIFKGDWYCKFEYNGSDKNHSGLLLYTTSSEFITFDTLGVESLIEIFCTNNNITIKVDGVLPDSVYTTQPSSGTKVGFFCHEDYSVSVKNFVANGELYKAIGTSTTDSNGNCSWNFSNGLSKGLYSFYIDNNHIDTFVGLFVNENSIQHIGSFHDLQQLINNAASGDTIILDKDYKSTPDDYYYTVLNKSLTIIGNGHTIDQNGQYYTDMPETSYPALYINSSNVIIKDINFINADTGAIIIQNNNATIENCNFINCQSKYITDNASGIHHTGLNTPTIKNCSFINCSDTNGRGGIYSDIPIITEDCTFYNSSTYRVTNKKSIYNTPNKNYIEDQIYYLTYQENHLNTDHDYNDEAFSQTVTGDFKIKTKTSEGFSGSITIYQPSYNFDVTFGFGDDGIVLSSDLTGDERTWNTTYYDNSEECDIEIWYEYDKTGIFLCGEKIDIKVYIKINGSIISFLSDYTVDMETIYAISNNIPYLNVVKEFDVSIGIDNGEFIDFSLFNGKKINDHTHSTEPIQHTHMVSQIPNVEPVELLVTYSDNTTDVLTLLRKTYEYYDKALNDNANYYESVFGITDQISWDSNEYLITYAENGYHDVFDLIALPNISLENNMKISMDIKLLGSSYMYNGMIGFYEPEQGIMFGGWAQGEKYYRLCEFENIDGDILQTTPNDQWSYLSINDYNHHELIYKNETVTYTITNPSGVSKTLTMNLRNIFLGSFIGILVECFGTNACYVKNIKVERI